MRIRMADWSFEQKIRAYVLRTHAKKTIRQIEENLGLARSTIHDNLDFIEQEVQSINDSYTLDNSKLLVFVVLALTMDGQVSSRRVETVLKKIWGATVSHQTILEILKHAAGVASELNSKTHLDGVRNALVDEVFYKSRPILGFCDSASATIALSNSDGRSGEDWGGFLDQLKIRGLEPISVTCDGGSGMLKGIKDVFGTIVLSRDIFHVLYKLSKAKRSMEGRCYRLMIATDKQEAGEKKATLEAQTELAIVNFDAFERSLDHLTNGWRLGSGGDNPYVTSSDLGIIIDHLILHLSKFMAEIGQTTAIKDAFTYLKEGKGHILAYKKTIEAIVAERFGPVFDEVILTHFMSLIENLAAYARSYENTDAKDHFGTRVSELRRSLRSYAIINQTEVDRAINECWAILREITPCSSLIECVNSVIRAHLNTYKSIPSWFCDLFTFYWNHRHFSRGKRQSFAPVELLHGKRLAKDWIEILVDHFPHEKLRSGLPCQPSFPEALHQQAA